MRARTVHQIADLLFVRMRAEVVLALPNTSSACTRVFRAGRDAVARASRRRLPVEFE